MVRITGSVRSVNSLSSPTGELLSSVVRRINGNSAKRMSGTESNAPTKNEPSPSNTPRNERLPSRDDLDGESWVSCVLNPPLNMRCLNPFESGLHHLQSR